MRLLNAYNWIKLSFPGSVALVLTVCFALSYHPSHGICPTTDLLYNTCRGVKGFGNCSLRFTKFKHSNCSRFLHIEKKWTDLRITKFKLYIIKNLFEKYFILHRGFKQKKVILHGDIFIWTQFFPLSGLEKYRKKFWEYTRCY